MRLTRHARNRLRLNRRSAPGVTDGLVLEALEHGADAGYDAKGNKKVRVAIGESMLTVVVDGSRGVVITVWREE
jgi:hypothetical protein